jgi:hypothetical protein
MATATFASDYSFGTANEDVVRGRLEKALGTNLTKRGGFASFDYDNGSTVFAELKSRRISHTTYPTTLIGANKVDVAAANPSRQYWFCFSYSDGLYGIRYDKEKFAGYERRLYTRGERPDARNGPQDVVFIPTEDLTCFSE